MKLPWERIGKVAMGVIVVCLICSVTLYGLYRVIRGKPEERVTEVQNGSFKVVIRSQEFLHSGTVNIDICVAETSSRTFPTKGAQCFLNGYDFGDLSAKWLGNREIEISFKSGWLSQFRNYALVSPKNSSVPVGFHISVHDENCQTLQCP